MSSTFRARHQTLNCFPRVQRTALNEAMVKHMTARLPAAVTATQSSTTLAPMTDFTIDDFQAGTAHQIVGTWNLSIANAAHNLKFDFNGGTATATSVSGTATFTLANGTNAVTSISALNTSIDGSTTNAWIAIDFKLLVVIATPGSIIPQFAQSASGATNSTVSAGFLRAINLN